MKLHCPPLHLAVWLFLFVHCSRAQSSPSPSAPAAPAADTIVLPPTFSDPIEPVNRAIWNFNKGLLTSVIKPVSVGYRFAVAKPVRTGIGNAGRNLTYPGRLVNEALQGDWEATSGETARVFVNTVFGVGGFFDVATIWNLPKREANFAQTFKKWGFHPGIFLMLPVFGPSDIRDGLGLACDAAGNPLTYFY